MSEEEKKPVPKLEELTDLITAYRKKKIDRGVRQGRRYTQKQFADEYGLKSNMVSQMLGGHTGFQQRYIDAMRKFVSS